MTRFTLLFLLTVLAGTATAQTTPAPPPTPVLAPVSTSLAAFNTSSRVALPASPSAFPTLYIYNDGNNEAFFSLGSSTVTAATATSTPLPSGVGMSVYLGGATYVAAITAASTTTLRISQLNGSLAVKGGGRGGGPSGPILASGVTNDSSVTGGTVKDALDTLNTSVMPAVADGQLLGNISGSSGLPTGKGLSAFLDYTLGSTPNTVAFRNGSIWTSQAIIPGFPVFTEPLQAVSGLGPYTLSSTPAGPLLSVYLDGVLQKPTDYVVSGTNLTFNGGFPIGSYTNLQVLYTTTSGPGVGGAPGGSAGQGQWNNGGFLAGWTASGDCNVNFSTGVITCTKFNGGTAFGSLAGKSSVSASDFTGPLGPTAGGTGYAAAPTTGQLLVGQPSGLYAAVTPAQDCTISTAGVVTCLSTNGVPFSGFATLTGATAGDLFYYNGSSLVRFPGNASGTKFLTENGSGALAWAGGSTVPGTTCGQALVATAIDTAGNLTCTPAITGDPATAATGTGKQYLLASYQNATTAYTATTLVVNLEANLHYDVDFYGHGSNSANGDGVQFNVLLSAPTGCVMNFAWSGQASTSTATSRAMQTSSNQASTTTVWNNATGGITGQPVEMHGDITGCTTGTVLTIQGKSVTGGTTTLEAGSRLTVIKGGFGV